MKRRPRVHRPQRGLPRLKGTRQRPATDTLEPPGENRACPHVTAAKRRRLYDAKMGGTAKVAMIDIRPMQIFLCGVF